jgi:serine phosphatase RsbU (regulator of sigma subunit)
MIHDSPDAVLKGLQHNLNQPNGLVVPMMIKNDLLGMLFFTLPENQIKFDDKQQRFAVMLAGQATLALENALLYEIQREQERFKRELEIAREVQQKLLPERMPEMNGFQIEGFCRSALEVGGDYFDFFQLDQSRLGVVIADVSGKGTSASFYMAEIKGMMLQLASRIQSPRALLTEINQHLYANVDRHLFVTMIYGILDQSSGEFKFSRAGHNSLLFICSDNSHQLMTPSGIGLGLDKGKLFQKKIVESRIILSEGDMLVFYTDGITEAMNAELEEFGEERLIKFCLQHSEKPLQFFKTEILKCLENFMGDQPQHDDLTMVMLRRKP